MSREIENIFEEILEVVPSNEEDELLITKDTLPAVPNVVKTKNLCITKGFHEYGCLRIDLLSFFAKKRTYRSFGLLILSAIFSEIHECDLILTHPNSEIKKIKLYFDKPDLASLSSGFHTKAFAFNYMPENVDRHPWFNCGYQNCDLPYIKLTNEDDIVLTESERASRDVLEGFGNDHGAALIAELFLNISRPAELLDRIDLECESGYVGVKHSSAEAWIWIEENSEHAKSQLQFF